MKLSFFVFITAYGLTNCVIDAQRQGVIDYNKKKSNILKDLSVKGSSIEEVIVQSSLFIKPKVSQLQPILRRTRRSFDIHTIFNNSLVKHKRLKRLPICTQQQKSTEQPGTNFAQIQVTANAAANSHYNNEKEFGAFAENAQGEAYNANGLAGSFNAFSDSSFTQASNIFPFGTQNSNSHKQTTAPNGQIINFVSTNNFANGPSDNTVNSHSNTVPVQ